MKCATQQPILCNTNAKFKKEVKNKINTDKTKFSTMDRRGFFAMLLAPAIVPFKKPVVDELAPYKRRYAEVKKWVANENNPTMIYCNRPSFTYQSVKFKVNPGIYRLRK